MFVKAIQQENQLFKKATLASLIHDNQCEWTEQIPAYQRVTDTEQTHGILYSLKESSHAIKQIITSTGAFQLQVLQLLSTNPKIPRLLLLPLHFH